MKKKYFILFFYFLLFTFCFSSSFAQCSICTKTAQQLGPGPAKGLNEGIIYLALTPFAVIGLIGYRWWKREKEISKQELSS